MKNIIVDRCCGNCEWSISPDTEEDIMLENSYEEDDSTRPRVGDCCLCIEHNGDFVCNQHEYIFSGLKSHVFYDDKDIGPGYYMVNTYYDNIINFFKLYRTIEHGKYIYGFRAIDLYPIKKRLVNGVSFEIKNYGNNAFYTVISSFANDLDNNIIWDNDKNSFMSVNIYEDCIGLYFTGSKDNNFIEVTINNTNDKNFKLIEQLFINIALVTSNIKNEEVYKKVRSINK